MGRVGWQVGNERSIIKSHIVKMPVFPIIRIIKIKRAPIKIQPTPKYRVALTNQIAINLTDEKLAIITNPKM